MLFKPFKGVWSLYHFIPFYVASVTYFAAAFFHRVLDIDVNGTFLCLSSYVYFTIYDNLKLTRLLSIHFEPLFLKIISGFEDIRQVSNDTFFSILKLNLLATDVKEKCPSHMLPFNYVF